MGTFIMLLLKFSLFERDDNRQKTMNRRKHLLCALLLGSLSLAPCASAITILLPNGDFSSTTLTNGSGDETSLDQGWYAKNADDGVRVDPINWSIGATVATPGVMTHTANSGSKTRTGMFFTMDPQLDGTGWSLEFDLGGTGTFELLRVWGGTLDATPSGNAFVNGSDAAPSANLVDGSGWTELVSISSTTSPGHVVVPITEDLGNFDVMVIKIRARGSGVNTTYDNFAFTNPIPEPSHSLLALIGASMAFLRRRR